MNTVGFIARAFRFLIEVVNVIAAFCLLVFVVFYVTRRDEVISAGAGFGYYSDTAIVVGVVISVVSYVLIMGLLCTFIEIRSSLARIETRLGEQDFTPHSSSRNQSEPRL